MTKGFHDTSRRVLRISGADRASFLQGLVSNDVGKQGAVYAALLTPQGKYLFDFFLIEDGNATLLDVAADRVDALTQRLNMYRLRADVTIAPTDIDVWRGVGDLPDAALPDPRHQAMGWRYYGDAAPEVGPLDPLTFEPLRVEHLIPEPELIESDTYILEAGFERLNGVDFRKGCYVGQEITARMKHKTELKKGLAKVGITGNAPFGTAVTTGGKPAGTLYTVSGNQAIAYLRFDRATGEMQAGDATLRLA